ncbi:hypothetical protein D3C81_1523120 [compost metagenome]
MQRADGRAPVLLCGLLQSFRQGIAGIQQCGILLPVGEQPGAGTEGGDEALGRGDTALGAGAQRQGVFGDGFQRRILGVDQGNAEGAAFAQITECFHQIGALSGLREGKGHLSAHLQRRMPQGDQRHRQRRHRQAEALHAQVGEVAGSVIRAAAGDGQRHLRRHAA